MSRDVSARIRFLVDNGEMPVSATVGPTGQIEHRGDYEVREVRLEDARARETSLDREGFVRIDAVTGVTDFHDPEQVRGRYYDEVKAIVQAQTGARRVEIFDHTIRSRDPDEQAAKVLREPLDVAHNDYTEDSGLTRLELALPDEADDLAGHRFAIIQVWRPTHETVAERPLAFCDATSIAQGDFIRAERRHRDRVGYIYNLRYAAHHRWYWFPSLRRDEALVFKVFDSDATRTRFTPHASPVLVAQPPDAAPRRSIEVRALALF